MPHQKITQALVDGLPFQDSTQWIHDTDLAGFNLSVGRRTKTYYAAGEAGGRFIRVKIGRADVTKANEARAVARDILLPEIRRGVDPRAKQLGDDDRTYARIMAGIREARPEDLSDQAARRIIKGKAKRRADELTVGQVWKMYEEHKRASILEEKGPEKARRAEQHIVQQCRYLGGADTYGKDGPYAATHEWPGGWWNRPITSITPELCSQTWRNLTRTRGRRTAQMFFMAVQVLFNYAVAKKEVPVTAHPMVIDAAGDGIGLPKGWQSLRAQNAVERISDIRAWWRQVDKLTVIPKSALKVALLTGMRPSEVLAMRWDQVDLDAGKVWFGMTKTTDYREVALSSWTVAQLKRLTDLTTFFDTLGVEGMADTVFRNRQRTSSRSGILKAEAVLLYCRALTEAGIDTFADFDQDRCEYAEAMILGLPGQSSGIAFDYFMMLAGDDNLIKPDRMVQRYVANALELDAIPQPRQAAILVRLAAKVLRKRGRKWTPLSLDHAIWRFQSAKASTQD